MDYLTTLSLVLIVLKITKLVRWSWSTVLSPVWIPAATIKFSEVIMKLFLVYPQF